MMTTATRAAQPRFDLQLYLRAHANRERELLGTLFRYFDLQSSMIARRLETFDRPALSQAATAFDADAEHKRLLNVVSSDVLYAMGSGASRVLTARAKSVKDLFAGFRLPPAIRRRMDETWQELERQPYWRAIQTGTQEQLTKLLQKAIDGGLTGRQTATAVEKALGMLQAARARAIARTETTLAFNAGHQAAYDELAEAGEIRQKEWLAIRDDDVRPEHVAADGQRVGVGEGFKLAGRETPYPGHWSLPAKQRVNCRCTTVAVFSD